MKVGNVRGQWLRALMWRAARALADALRVVARSLWRVFVRWPRPLLYKLLVLVCFVSALVEGTYIVAFAPEAYAIGSVAPAAIAVTATASLPPTVPPPVYSVPTAVPTIAPIAPTAVPTAVPTTAPLSPSAAVVDVAGGRFYVEPDAGVAPLVSLIRVTRRSLDGEIYLLSSAAVLDALGDAVRRGVRVRLVLDPRPFGGESGSADTAYKILTAEGVAVRWSSSAYRFTHAKFLVSDTAVAWVGTMNWTNAAFIRNREFAEETDAAAVVQESDALFAADWDGRPLDTATPDLVVSPTNARATILSLIAGVRYSLDLYAEEIYDAASIQALADATRRGVRVRIVYAGLGDAEGLSGIGGQVARVASPYIHAKAIVADGTTLFVGSENLSATSLDRNREVGLLLRDRVAIAQVEQAFDQDLRRERPTSSAPLGAPTAESPATPAAGIGVQASVTPAIMPYNAYPILAARSTPGATCAADVVYATGYTPVSFDGSPQTVGASGVVRWGWHEMTKGDSGRATVRCTLKGTPWSATTTFAVTH